MKRLAFAVALAILVWPVYTAAKDAGPATKPAVKKVESKKVEPKPVPKKAPAKAATTKKTAAPKPAVKNVPKKTPKSAVPASQPAKADVKTPDKGEIKVEGKVEISEDEVKIIKEAEFSLVDTIYAIYTNFKAGKVWDGIALLLMLLTFLMGKFKTDIPIKYLPWIAAGMGIATNIVSAIVGGVEWGSALSSGLFQGAAAAGFWSMVGKHFLRNKDEKSKREAAREMVENGAKASGEVNTKDKHEDDTK